MNNLKKRLESVCLLIKERKRSIRTFVVRLILFAFLAALFCALYFQGLDWGKPYITGNDEHHMVNPALSIIATGDFAIPDSSYGNLPMYLQSFVSTITHFYMIKEGKYGDKEFRGIGGLREREKFCFYQAGRATSAIFAGLLALAVFYLAKLLVNRSVGYLSVLAVVVFPLVVTQAHEILPNMLTVLLAITSVYQAAIFASEGKKSSLYISAVFSGLAMGCKLTMVTCIVVPLLALLLYHRRMERPGRNIILLIAIHFLTFVAVTPTIVLDLQQYVWSISYYVMYRYTSWGFCGWHACDNTPLRYLEYIWERGPLFFSLSCFGLLSLPFFFGKKGLIVWTLPLVYFISISSVPFMYARHFLPLVPFLAIGFGVSAYVFYILLLKVVTIRLIGPRLKRLLAFALVIVVAGIALYEPGRQSFMFIKQYRKVSTATLADNWIVENIKYGTKIASEKSAFDGYRFVLPFPDEGYKISAQTVTLFDNPYVSLIGNDYAVSKYLHYYRVNDWNKDRVERVILEADKRLRANASVKKHLRDYLIRNAGILESRLSLLKEFTPGKTVSGPRISIFRVPEFRLLVLGCSDFAATGNAEGLQAGGEPIRIIGLASISSGELSLAGGEYDLFLKAEGGWTGEGEIPVLSVRIEDRTFDTTIFFPEKRYYYVGTVGISEESGSSITITGRNKDGNVKLYEVVISQEKR